MRRFVWSSAAQCSGASKYHNAMGPELGVFDEIEDADGYVSVASFEPHRPPKDDPRWPRKCEACAYEFTDADEWQLFSDSIYVDAEGKEHSLRSETPGMMWDAWWFGECWAGPDGKHLMVYCPNGKQWLIDGPANNCTMKDDTGPYGVAHRCWTRTGTPPLITVSKAYGKTCAAGAGSIQAGDYHGFLQNGEFT